MIKKDNVKYYRDFDIYNFHGINELKTDISYPYVEYEEIKESNMVRLKFSMTTEYQFEEYFEKKQNYFFSSSKSIPDGEFWEYTYLYIKNGNRYQFTYFVDSVWHKDSPLEFFLKVFTISNKNGMRSVVFNNPQKKYQPNDLLKHGPFEVKYDTSLVFSQTNINNHLEKDKLLVTTKRIFYNNDDSQMDENCYNLHGFSLNWYYYFGNLFKVDCR
jgi:hypothetical protein